MIDHNTDSGSLLVRTLSRKFPLAVIQLCGDVGTVTNVVSTEKFDVIALHRTEDLSGVDLIQTIRALDATVPILAVSGRDRSTESLAAGANAFLYYDEWLRVGTVVSDLLQRAAQDQELAARVAGLPPPKTRIPFSPPETGNAKPAC